MINKHTMPFLCLGTGLIISSAVSAQTPTKPLISPDFFADSLYAGLETGRTTYEKGTVGQERALNLKATLGMDLDQSFALEGSYAYFGKGQSSSGDYSAWSIGAAGVLKHPISKTITLTAKAGLELASAEIKQGGEFKDTAFDLFYGFGLIAKVSPIMAITANWENHGFEIKEPGRETDLDADVFNIGARIYF